MHRKVEKEGLAYSNSKFPLTALQAKGQEVRTLLLPAFLLTAVVIPLLHHDPNK